MLLLPSVDFFQNSFRNTISLRVSNSFGHSVSPELGSIYQQMTKVVASKERANDNINFPKVCFPQKAKVEILKTL